MRDADENQRSKDTYAILLEKIGQLNETICELSTKINNLKILCHNAAEESKNESSNNHRKDKNER